MRPKKIRRVSCPPGERHFRPAGMKISGMKAVVLSLDELEAVRLADLEENEQVEVARKMKIHRSTVSRILASARKKIADALINCKAIKAEGGCCEYVNSKC